VLAGPAAVEATGGVVLVVVGVTHPIEGAVCGAVWELGSAAAVEATSGVACSVICELAGEPAEVNTGGVSG
jgi:hypothetical protein